MTDKARMPLANYPGDALPLRKTVPLDNIDTSEDETAWLKLHPTEVLSPPPTGPNFSSSTSSPERARQAEAGSGGNQPFVVIPLPSQNTPQWQAEPSQQEPGHAKADKGPPPERADRVDEEFHAYRSPPASTDLPPEILAIPVEEAFPSTYTYDFKTEDGAIPGMKPAPAIPAQAEKSIPMSSVCSAMQTADWLEQEILHAEDAILRTKETLDREGSIHDQLYADYDFICKDCEFVPEEQHSAFQEAIMRTGGEILRQHNILIHQEEVLRLLHVYYDYDYVTCPCSRATEACPECAAKEDKNGVYTMMSPVFCNLKDSVSPSTVQVPVHYYDSESPTIDVPVYYYSTVEPKMVSGNEKESRVSWVPVTKVIVLPQVLVIAVRQPTVAGTRTYTAQGVEC